MNLAARIRRARSVARMTQAALAEKIGVRRGAVAQWEQVAGTSPTLANLASLAVACEVRFEWVATGRGPMRPDESMQAPALVTSEFAHDAVEARLLDVIRKFNARKREAIVDMLEQLAR